MNSRITAYIHMDAIGENFENMRKNLTKGTKIIAVVKTDGYGHGAIPVAKLAETLEYIWGYAVAAVSEAKELRKAGIKKPVLILGYTFAEDYAWMAENEIRPAVFTMEMALKFAAAAKACGRIAPIHIAVDTGMSRIGVSDGEEGLSIVRRISELSSLKIEGVFTHFAKADESDKSFTFRQLERFTGFCSAMEALGIHSFLKHCSNSAGILEIPQANMDMVRAGISIYGIYPSNEANRNTVTLKPAMELKSHIVYIKKVSAGTGISYGSTFVADKDMAVATIPAGYGDGYPRSLSNKGYVLIRGHKAPILGKVCMDQFMVDVTGLKVKLLDEVTLLGSEGKQSITLYDLEQLSGRFPYEFVCGIGKRVPRIYLGFPKLDESE